METNQISDNGLKQQLFNHFYYGTCNIVCNNSPKGHLLGDVLEQSLTRIELYFGL